jgi:hypothetical protein
MDEELEEFMKNPTFQSFFQMGKLHRECEEIRDVREQVDKALEMFGKTVLEHHAKCSKR